jgi:hypothetical protein
MTAECAQASVNVGKTLLLNPHQPIVLNRCNLCTEMWQSIGPNTKVGTQISNELIAEFPKNRFLDAQHPHETPTIKAKNAAYAPSSKLTGSALASNSLTDHP